MVTETQLVKPENDLPYFLTIADIETICDAIESGENVLVHMDDPNCDVFTMSDVYIPILQYMPERTDPEVQAHFGPFFTMFFYENLETHVQDNHLKIGRVYYT